MVQLKSALTAMALAAGVAVVVSIFVVSAGALPGRNNANVDSPSSVQYDREATTPKHFEKGPGPGYYHFYNRWAAKKGASLGVAQASDPSAAAPPRGVSSEGSEVAARAPAQAREVMEPPTPYSQVVDNATPRKFFAAPDWRESDKRVTRHGKDYRFVRPDNDVTPAWFRVRIPEDGFYAVYARWPQAKGNNPKTRFQVSTASGVRKTEVNQRRDGGVWVRLGAYKMDAGNRYSVRVAGRSEAEGRVVADAVMVVAGTQAAPETGNDATSLGGREPAIPGVSAGGGATPVGASPVEEEVLERARSHLGTPYKHSPPMTCTAYSSEDCSCFTSLVFSKWVTMPDNPVGQWYVGRPVEKGDLLPGDLVFFKEAGMNRPITHVGIYSGRGQVLHASVYWGQVVESPMKYLDGYYGARRLT
jgi:cell wall-associated NlpC family hydrolase